MEKTITMEVSQAGSGITEVISFSGLESLSEANVQKFFYFLLVELNCQNFPPVIRFNIDDLVSEGIFTQKINAYRDLRTAFEAILTISISGKNKKGKKVISEYSGLLFYHMRYRNGDVEISVNKKINWEVFADFLLVNS